MIFCGGVFAMFGVALATLAQESDGDFRTRERMRSHRNLFLASAGAAVVAPMAAWIAGVSSRVGRKSAGPETKLAEDAPGSGSV